MEIISILAMSFIGILVTAFILKRVFELGSIVTNQQNQIRILEAIYKQNGGTREQLYPELFKNKVVQNPTEEKKDI